MMLDSEQAHVPGGGGGGGHSPHDWLRNRFPPPEKRASKRCVFQTVRYRRFSLNRVIFNVPSHLNTGYHILYRINPGYPVIKKGWKDNYIQNAILGYHSEHRNN